MDRQEMKAVSNIPLHTRRNGAAKNEYREEYEEVNVSYETA